MRTAARTGTDGRDGDEDGAVATLELVIRPATVDGARAIADIRVAGWRTAYAGLIEQQVLDGLDPVAGAERRRRDWGTQPRTAAVATLGGSVVGFMTIGAYDGDGDRADWPPWSRAPVSWPLCTSTPRATAAGSAADCCPGR